MVLLSVGGFVNGACPNADVTGDCRVDLADLAEIASGWQVNYGPADLAELASQWLDDGAFVTTWDTSLGDGTTVTLALGGEVDAEINWGDGSVDTVTTPGPHVHDYGVDGVYTVSVTGSVTEYHGRDNGSGGVYKDEKKLVSVDSWGGLGFTSMRYAFYECDNLIRVPSTTKGLESVTNMADMFKFADSFNYDIGDWDISNVTDIHSMFWGATSFNQDIGDWDTSNVTDMRIMFHSASSFNQDIGGWDTSNVNDMWFMWFMFYNASSFNQDLSNWCVLQIDSEPGNFDYGADNWTLPRPNWGTCPGGKPFQTTWDTSLGSGKTVSLALAGEVDAEIDWGDGTVEAVTTVGPHVHDYGVDGVYTVAVSGKLTAYNSKDNGGVESEPKKLISVDSWGLLGFTSLSDAFSGCKNLVSVPGNSNWIEAVTDMSYMFEHADSFNLDIGGWDTSNVRSMSGMFLRARAFNQEIGEWDTSNVTDMSHMFKYATAFNNDIRVWDTSNVTNMTEMFSGASSFNQDLSKWCVPQISIKPDNFDDGASSWVLPRPIWGRCPASEFVTTWNTSLGEGTTVTLALGGEVDAKIDWGDGTVRTVTTPGPHVHDYGVEGVYKVWVLGSVTAYNSVHNGGDYHEQSKLVSVDCWGRMGFTSFFHAFSLCTNLVSVPATTEGIETVRNMGAMFYYAQKFNQNIGQWDTSRVKYMHAMFDDASSFNQDISGWDTSSVIDMGRMFSDARSFNQNLSGWCVEKISTEPANFDDDATSWTLPRPNWGAACSE